MILRHTLARLPLLCFAVLALFALVFASPYDASATTCDFGSAVSGGQCIGFLTSGTSWTVPADWNSASNTIEVIGGGGAGGASGGLGIGGGGGGAYAEIANLSLTPSNSVSYQVGAGAPAVAFGNGNGTSGGDTYFNGAGATCASQSICAKGGNGGSGTSLGVSAQGGTAASSVGTIKNSGGNGGAGNATKGGDPGSGGGGAAGPNGAGGAGGGNAAPGGTGDNGHGGAGGGSQTPGGVGTEWDSSHGSGGGGGGSSNGTSNGAIGGKYGGGGGGGGGGGAGGLIVIKYAPLSTPSVTTNAAIYIKTTSAELTGNITATGGANATQSGFAFGTNGTLTSGVSTSTLGAQTGTAFFANSVTGLSPATTYYYRAYATNSAGTGYGTIASFRTPSLNTTSARVIRLVGHLRLTGHVRLF
jgi:hypothetical protein